MKRFMVDIETMGTSYGCQLLSIAMVDFTHGVDGPAIHFAVCDPTGHRDPATVEWWSQQSDEARAAFDRLPVYDASAAASRIREFVEQQAPSEVYEADDVEFWARGPDFDRSLIEAMVSRVNGRGVVNVARVQQLPLSAFDRMAQEEEPPFPVINMDASKLPWQFWQWRDVRTMEAVAETVGAWHPAKNTSGAAHDALADCRAQASGVLKMLDSLAKLEAKRRAPAARKKAVARKKKA